MNTYDVEGGAARAASRLHEALRRSGVDSAMFVQQRSGAATAVVGPHGNLPRLLGRLRWQLDQLPADVAGARRGEFSLNLLGGNLASRLRTFDPDVVHLHWINAGYVSLREVRALRMPVFWTAHDMWPFTGGCHYDQGCGRFEDRHCRPCPLQYRLPALPLAQSRLEAKDRVARGGKIQFVCPSRWMAGVAQRSAIGRNERIAMIPNTIDLNRFKNIDKRAARDLFGLPQDRILMLFGGNLANSDPRKGFQCLDAALSMLAATGHASEISLCVFGSATRHVDEVHGISIAHVGHLHDDESLIALYSACDFFVAPSLQDNLPNTVLEAAACGIPTVAFDTGGISDLVVHDVSGWLAPVGDARRLADGILRAAGDEAWRRSAGSAARSHVEALFGYATVAAAHLALYEASLETVGVGA